MIEVTDKEHFSKVIGFAIDTGRFSTLLKSLVYLDTYAEENPGDTICVLGKDFAPASFSFLMKKRNEDGSYRDWFRGGLVFHGNHDGFGSGAAPTLAVTLNPSDGWSVHT